MSDHNDSRPGKEEFKFKSPQAVTKAKFSENMLTHGLEIPADGFLTHHNIEEISRGGTLRTFTEHYEELKTLVTPESLPHVEALRKATRKYERPLKSKFLDNNKDEQSSKKAPGDEPV